MTIFDRNGHAILAHWKGSPCTIAKSRKEARCAKCGRQIPVGEEVWRPIDNSLHRADRLHRGCLP